MSTAAEWAIAVIVVINTLFVGGIAVAMWLLHNKMTQALQQVEPLIARANETLGKVEDMAEKTDQRVTEVLDRADLLVRDVSQKVETTTAIAEETISQPLIGAASLMAGISRGLSVYKEATEKGDGDNHG